MRHLKGTCSTTIDYTHYSCDAEWLPVYHIQPLLLLQPSAWEWPMNGWKRWQKLWVEVGVGRKLGVTRNASLSPGEEGQSLSRYRHCTGTVNMFLIVVLVTEAQGEKIFYLHIAGWSVERCRKLKWRCWKCQRRQPVNSSSATLTWAPASVVSSPWDNRQHIHYSVYTRWQDWYKTFRHHHILSL